MTGSPALEPVPPPAIAQHAFAFPETRIELRQGDPFVRSFADHFGLNRAQLEEARCFLNSLRLPRPLRIEIEDLAAGPWTIRSNQVLKFSELTLLLSAFSTGRGVVKELFSLLALTPQLDPLRLHFNFSESRVFPEIEAAVTAKTPLEAMAELLPRFDAQDLGVFFRWIAGGLSHPHRQPYEDLQARIEGQFPVETLTAITYNVFGMPWSLPEWMGGKAPQRYEAIGRGLAAHNPTVVALQEMWDRRTDVIPETLGVQYHSASAGKMHGIFGAHGLLTVSRLPVVSAEHLRFSDSRNVERLVSKGVLHSRHARGGSSFLDVFNAHLISTTSLLSEQKATVVREAQFEEFLDWVDRRHTPGDPWLAMGDFNTNEQNRLQRRLAQHLGRDSYRAAHSPARLNRGTSAEQQEADWSGFTFDPTRNRLASNPDGKPERLDYIFGSSLGGQHALRSSLLFVDQAHSDHYALKTEYEFA